MKNRDFTIIFKKLEEARSESALETHGVVVEASPQEIDEIDELRRIVLETTNPDPASYTST